MTRTAETVAPRAPFFDPWARAAHLTTLRAACEACDADRILDFLRATTTPDELSFTMWLVADADGVEECLETAVETDGTDLLARTLLALRYVAIGWGIRSSARAEYVSAEQFEQFHDWLRRAERLLIDVCADDPTYAPAWEVRLTTARGLELGHAESRRRYDHLAAQDAHHFGAQSTHLQQILPKWGGSWEAAEAFVSACAEQAPAGSLSHALVADLVLERWLALDGGEEAYLSQPDTLARLQAGALQSVWHAEHVPSPRTVSVHSRLAFLFSMANRHADAAAHFRMLGEHPSDEYWMHTHSPEGWYRRSRALALGEKPVPPVPQAKPEPLQPGQRPEGVPTHAAFITADVIFGLVAAFFGFIGFMVLTEEPVDAGSWQIAVTMFVLALMSAVFPVVVHVRAARLMRKAGLR